MKMMTTAAGAAFLLQAMAFATFAPAHAAERPPGFPSQQVRVVVPFPPGGTSDIVGRIIAQRLATSTGQRFLVENRPGAGAAIGITLVTSSTPDGQTLLLGAAGPLTMSPHMSRVPYDADRDLAPIALVTAVPNIVVVHPSVPAKTLAELVSLVRARPGNVNFGSAGQGTTAHLSGELFRALAGVDMVHVPYKGTSAAVADLVGGQIDLLIDNLPGVLPQVRAGKLRALALTSDTRSKAAADVPSAPEAGMKELIVSGWFGFFGPAKTPQPIVEWMAQEIIAAAKTPEVQAQLADLGGETDLRGPAAFRAYLRAESERWGRIIRAAKIQVQ
ncbi:MAG: tripartite tricarboxylate transporter substrate binding protein [Proteobacteria bacterium]|nr:tripartite tricarboxylate transporter substrate binding protein [Burkholderiales bacterium]